MDYEVQRCTRRCAATGRELLEGERFFSVLVAEGAAIERRDYCEEAWPGPPEKHLGWWKSQAPRRDAQKAKLAPNDVLFRYFEEVEAAAGPGDLLYVLALLLVRRRVLRVEETAKDAQGQECLTLYSTRDETKHCVVAQLPEDARIAEIEAQLQQLLFAHAA